MTAKKQRVVFVVMGNDYPAAVFTSQTDAELYCTAMREKNERSGNRVTVYWRTYGFTLDGALP